MSNRRVRIVFVFNLQNFFQVPTFVPRDGFGNANTFEARYMDVLAQWLFAPETTGTNPAYMDVVEQRRAWLSTNNRKFLVQNHCYEQFVTSSLDFAIGSRNIPVLIQDRTIPA